MLVFVLPIIDPVLISFGWLKVRWYGLAYVIGIILCCYAMMLLDMRNKQRILNYKIVDSLILYMAFGIIFGGRIGYVIFYHSEWLIDDILKIFKIWEGGMSFHGGLIGAIAAIYVLHQKFRVLKLNLLQVYDMFSTTTPVGLFLGRVANLINAELYGRITNVPWAVIFPTVDSLPRHPSQIYEAVLEGIILFVIMITLYYKTNLKDNPGTLSGLFLCIYSIFRIIAENYREPDEHIGFVIFNITLGQLLSMPMLVVGIYMTYIYYFRRIIKAT